MNTAYLFRRFVYAQVLLGIVASCMAERNPGLLIVAGAIGAMSWYVTEGPQGKTLPRIAVNIGALIAVIGLAARLAANRMHVVEAMGHFTMVLQLLMLYARKTDREYAQLLILSLLQMVGASVLSVSMIYGIFLGIYCAVALATVLLFHLTSAADRVHQENLRAAANGPAPARPVTNGTPSTRKQLRLMACGIGAVCGVVAVAVFVVMPRTGRSSLQLDSNAPRSTVQTGFSTTVRLGVGAIGSGSREPMLNLKVESQGQVIGWEDEPWLVRGAALDAYNPESHTWFRSQYAASTDKAEHLARLNGVLGNTADDEHSREYTAEIALRDLRHRTLFSVTPTPFRRGAPAFELTRFESETLGQLSYSPLDQQMRISTSAVGAATYRVSWQKRPTLLTPNKQAAAAADSTSITPTLPTAPPRESRRPHHSHGYPFTEEPKTTSETYARKWMVEQPRVRAYAERILKDAGYQRDPQAMYTPDDVVMAATLANHLQQNFTYNLDNPSPPKGKDPVITFLFENRSGHCELFAAGLVALCRSVGIQSRLVTGFRASEYNNIGGYYVVRQSNAHAWTEINGGPGVDWVTFDATPAAEVRAEHHVADGMLSSVRDFYEHIEFAWIKMIVAFDNRSQQSVLESVTASAVAAKNTGVSIVSRGLEGLKKIPDALSLSKMEAFAAGISATGLILACFVLVRIALNRRKRLRRLQLTTLAPQERRGLHRRLHFYLAMTDMLERHGYHRPDWQSPSSFADELAEANPMKFDPVVALTELFYEIRFGQRELDASRRQRIRIHLKQLETSLAKKTI